LGKVPAMDTPHGPIFESGAIQRYVGRLRPEAGLYGNSFYQAGVIDQWLDFITTEVDVARGAWIYPILGYVEFNQAVYEQAKKDMTRIMTVLNTHFLSNTYLVGNQITLADIALTSSLTELFRRVFDPTFLSSFQNVVRWFTTCVNQPNFEKVIGKVECAKQEEMAPKPAKEKKTAETASSSSSSSSSSSTSAPATKEKKPKEEKPKETKEKPAKDEKPHDKKGDKKPKDGDKPKKDEKPAKDEKPKKR